MNLSEVATGSRSVRGWLSTKLHRRPWQVTAERATQYKNQRINELGRLGVYERCSPSDWSGRRSTGVTQFGRRTEMGKTPLWRISVKLRVGGGAGGVVLSRGRRESGHGHFIAAPRWFSWGIAVSTGVSRFASVGVFIGNTIYGAVVRSQA